jgi:hypothetical protein
MPRNIKPYVTKDNVIKYNRTGFFVPAGFANQGGGSTSTTPGHPEIPPDDRIRACYAMEEKKEIVIECEIFWPKPKVGCGWFQNEDPEPDVPEDAVLEWRFTVSVKNSSYRKCLFPWTVEEDDQCISTVDDGSPYNDLPGGMSTAHPSIDWTRKPGATYTDDWFQSPGWVEDTGGHPEMNDGLCNYGYTWLSSNYFRIKYTKKVGPIECCRPCELGSVTDAVTGNITEVLPDKGDIPCPCDSKFFGPIDYTGEGSMPYEEYDDFCFPEGGYQPWICPNGTGSGWFNSPCTGPMGFLFGDAGGGSGRPLTPGGGPAGGNPHANILEILSDMQSPDYPGAIKYCAPCMQDQSGQEAVAEFLSEWQAIGDKYGC